MSESWLTKFESKLQQLELASAGEIPFFELMTAAGTALQALAGEVRLQQWLVRPDSLEVLSSDGTAQLISSEGAADVLQAAAEGRALKEATGSVAHNSLYTCHSLAEELTLVIGADYSDLECPQSSFTEGAQAVTDLVAAFVSRHLLSQYESRFQSHAALTQLVADLHEAGSLRDTANVLAQDGAAILGACRVTVLVKRDGAFLAEAITGVRTPESNSESVQAIQALATSLVAVESGWQNLDTLPEDAKLKAAAGCLRNSGVSQVRVAPLASGAEESGMAVLIELFAAAAIPDESTLQQLLSAAQQPMTQHYLRQQPLLSRLITSRRRRWAIGIGLAALALVLIPVRFEVEVPGQIVSANQQHVFAPDDGTIDEVFFENEAEVAGQVVLLRMSNADLELQREQLQGEVDTTKSKLAAVNLGRLTGGDASLSGDEKQLRQRLENLLQQQQLLIQQAQALEVKAPFAGTVFRPDPQQELYSRPVQRGQRLLEIVPEEPAWQLQLSIPSHLLNYVTEVRNQSTQKMQVRYMIRSAPEQNWETELSTLANAVQVEDGRTVCHAMAELKELPGIALRPGTSVAARISCGNRALGFVMFREVIELWQQFQFAWL